MSKAVNLERCWTSIRFEADVNEEELAAWLMIGCGALGCEVENLPGGRIVVKSSFESKKLSKTALGDLTERLEEYGLGKSLRTLKVEEFAEEDWLAKWKEGFEAFSIGKHFIVCPVWQRDRFAKGSNGKCVIVINPAMAFGTGLHATTQYCLKSIEKCDLNNRVLDVGTGSAILSIGTALLYPKASIVALDNHPQAIENARENIQLNHVENRIELIFGEPETVLSRQFDCILSNITCEDIIALLPDYMKVLAPSGKIICAGILKDKFALLEAALDKLELQIVDREDTGEWTGVTLVAKALP
jgi:ribosomal protein L11 methyltransferase